MNTQQTSQQYADQKRICQRLIEAHRRIAAIEAFDQEIAQIQAENLRRVQATQHESEVSR